MISSGIIANNNTDSSFSFCIYIEAKETILLVTYITSLYLLIHVKYSNLLITTMEETLEELE